MNWYRYASPSAFYPLAGKMIPWFAIPAAILFAVGLYIGFFVAPTDFQQGDAYRIMFIHVPAAWMGMRNRLGFQRQTFIDDGVVTCDHWRIVYFDFIGDRRVLGQADLGYLVGLGCAHDIHADIALSVHRLHFIAVSH